MTLILQVNGSQHFLQFGDGCQNKINCENNYSNNSHLCIFYLPHDFLGFGFQE